MSLRKPKNEKPSGKVIATDAGWKQLTRSGKMYTLQSGRNLQNKIIEEFEKDEESFTKRFKYTPKDVCVKLGAIDNFLKEVELRKAGKIEATFEVEMKTVIIPAPVKEIKVEFDFSLGDENKQIETEVEEKSKVKSKPKPKKKAKAKKKAVVKSVVVDKKEESIDKDS